jgi:hypothetical protein
MRLMKESMLCKGTAGHDEDMLGGSMEAVFDDASSSAARLC